MGTARLLVSRELLRDVLSLPDETVISGARYNAFMRTIELVVSHHDIPDFDKAEGEQLPIAIATFVATDRTRPIVELKDWGVREYT